MQMKTHVIAGGGGIDLHVIEQGNPLGRPIIFIHGFSQSALTWERQMNSDLARAYRLIALDLRGHGLSDKPRDSYADSRLWADDIDAVILALKLHHPILCGWSYGPLVILDYVRHYGEDNISGANFIGGVTRLGGEEATSVLTADFVGLIPGFFSANVEESVGSLNGLLSLCFAQLSTEDRYRMLGYSVSVPPHVRQGLFSRRFDNEDLLPTLRKPVLITHGTNDAVVKPSVIEQQMRSIAGARVQMLTDAGHACFWNDATAYNSLLQEFAESL
jgi:non-heme chloroperoxidase